LDFSANFIVAADSSGSLEIRGISGREDVLSLVTIARSVNVSKVWSSTA
jgi:hypothetical protein